MLVDAGPLYAYVDSDDAHHHASLELLVTHTGPLIVPILVVTEVTYLLGTRLGHEPEVRYEAMMAGEMKGTRLEGDGPRGWAEGSLGFGVDKAAFVLPDGSRLPTRLTGVLREEDGEWKVVHLHFSVGVPDEQAVVLASG